jgi:endonuclease YncB( thermonuclease family)
MKSGRPILLLLLAVSITAWAEDKIQGTVKEVIDGNTIRIETKSNESYHIYLHGIDSPEPGQRYAEQSTQLLQKLLLNKTVTIVLHGRDRHGNRIGAIYLDGAADPRHEMVRSGMAWPAEKHNDPQLEALVEEARQKNLGIWGDENPVPPWTYRRQQTMLEAKSS